MSSYLSLPFILRIMYINWITAHDMSTKQKSLLPKKGSYFSLETWANIIDIVTCVLVIA